MDDLANSIKLNNNYLSTLFKKETGYTVSEYILFRKLEVAENMLRFSDYSCAEIGSFLAFNSQSYFTQCFREKNGCTPAVFRKEHYNKHIQGRHTLHQSAELTLYSEKCIRFIVKNYKYASLSKGRVYTILMYKNAENQKEDFGIKKVMIRNFMTYFRKSFLRLIPLFLLTVFLCACRASADPNEDLKQEYSKWQKTLDEKWSIFNKVETDSDWFSVYELPSDVYAFFEIPYEQDVCSFLILGKEKALLLDIGLGIEKIRPLVEELTDLPIIVVNSHDHFDHIGGNAEFDEVWCYDIDTAVQHLSNGPTEEVDDVLIYKMDSDISVMLQKKSLDLKIPAP